MSDRRLNSVEPARFGKLSDQQKDELTAWFTSLATCEDPDKVLPVPDCYKPIVAWQQMHGSNIVNELDMDMKPWNMPAALIEYWADVWYVSRVGMLRAVQQKGGREHAHDGHAFLFGIHSDPEKGIGRA